MITNRLKPLLNGLVSPFQTTFIAGRNISENVILTQELLHGFKSKRGRSANMALKFDMSKAYDKMEWSFIEKVLISYGFDNHFVNLISQCISTTSLSVLINGSPHGRIFPQRGLRQGDPLSPYLFIICSEILSRLFARKEEEGSFRGIKIAVEYPPVTHLLFADDLIVFTKAEHKDANAVMDVLEVYKQWSGQEIKQGEIGGLFQ